MPRLFKFSFISSKLFKGFDSSILTWFLSLKSLCLSNILFSLLDSVIISDESLETEDWVVVSLVFDSGVEIYWLVVQCFFDFLTLDFVVIVLVWYNLPVLVHLATGFEYNLFETSLVIIGSSKWITFLISFVGFSLTGSW